MSLWKVEAKVLNSNQTKARFDAARQCQATHFKEDQDKFEELDGVEFLPHSTYSPDWAPSDYDLFCSMQHFLKGRRFNLFSKAKEAHQEFFDSKPAEWYFEQIQKLADRWQKILENDGLYFEE